MEPQPCPLLGVFPVGYLLSKWEGIVEPGSDRQSSNSPNTTIKLNYLYVNVNISMAFATFYTGTAFKDDR